MNTDLTSGVETETLTVEVLYLQKVNDLFVIESIDCIKNGLRIEVAKIPFHARRLALGDIISADYDTKDNAYYFEKRLASSGNSTVRILLLERKSLWTTKDAFEQLGCQCAEYIRKNVLAVNIPKSIPYTPIKRILQQGEKDCKWEYDEACMSHIAVPKPKYKNPAEINEEVIFRMQQLGKGLLSIRETRGQTQESVCNDLSIGIYTLDRIEKGIYSQLEIRPFLQLCAYYRIEPSNLF